MNRCDIQILRIHVGYPAITLIMPCDRAKIKAKFMELVSHLNKELGDEVIIAHMVANFDITLQSLVCSSDSHSVALFVNRYGVRCYYLPFPMPELVACDQTFKLDQIIARLNRLLRYWVLDCTGGAVQLYEGVAGVVTALNATHLVVDETGNFFVRKDDISGLGDYFEQDRLPICLVGAADEVYPLQMDAPFRERIVCTVANPHEVWPAMKRYFAQRLADACTALPKMKAGTEYVTDVGVILKEARTGWVTHLLFEEDYHLEACEEEVTRRVITTTTDCPIGYQKISLVDHVIEAVCAKGGELISAPQGALRECGRMVAMIREG